ncbi:MAG: hypothetical protein CL489_06750 [Acidobacteria bacterium]|nr:hypothetical protein [Acidobacteriota bacterium]|tara:strand:- start:3090 stop:3293 length:204 start_codon:yes stop_codon:yes gene_type:complete
MLVSLDVLNEAMDKKFRVGVLALGQYNECLVKRVWFDDMHDMVEFYILASKKKWKVANHSIALMRVL